MTEKRSGPRRASAQPRVDPNYVIVASIEKTYLQAMGK